MPVTVPSKCTADASSVDCRAGDHLLGGSVTCDAGISGASARRAPVPRADDHEHDHAEAGKATHDPSFWWT
jgi:hypothetical protein